MKRLAKILIATTAMAILPLTPTFADSSSNTSGGSQILNGQIALHTSISSLHTTIDNVGSDVGVQSVAGGNAVDITTMNDTHVTNNQYTSTVDISSDLGARVTNVGGNVGIQGQASCNSAGVSTDPNITAINSTQQCDAVDPTSRAYVDSANIGGSFSLSNSATGNTFQADSNASNMPVNTLQINHSNVNAVTTANVFNVAGTVSVTSAAIGNNAQIVHYSTGN
ncbi:MAG: hypothetical protein KGJ79_17205 [Alphaproteobacteria bacterium]|nr:hypothetical protein [Alphaproteobacteria bacterium]MDE2112878.1 hypothetical protein [Alphaproteobacteria bacterium]